MKRLTQPTIHRLPYVIGNGVMLVAAYLLLRLILQTTEGYENSFPDGWRFLDPLALMVQGRGERLWYTIAVHIALTVGLIWLAVKRARDAGWRPITAALMAFPVVRLFVFAALAMAPSQQHSDVLDIPRPGYLSRIIPRSKKGSIAAAILIAVILVIPLGIVSIEVFEDYGLALFIGLPFLLGLTSAYAYNYHEVRSMPSSIGVAALTISCALAILFLLAMEGAFCLIMAAPLLYGIAIAGAVIGHAMSGSIHNPSPMIPVLVLIAPGLMAFEANTERSSPLFPVITSVSIEATQQQVWDSLIAFSKMEEPQEALFRYGISYPVQARIEGTGVGAVRYCEFNTGPFVEPITIWNEPNLLAFDVVDIPPPMTELSIYDHIEAPHVDGYFRSKRGQFKLIQLSNGSTLLEGTTWYTHNIWPTWYWRLWSDAILHQIHHRVLDHIKTETEIVSTTPPTPRPLM